MLRDTILSVTPFALPAGCFSAGCSCEWMCRMGSPGCVAAAGILAALLFSTLMLANALRGLEVFRD